MPRILILAFCVFPVFLSPRPGEARDCRPIEAPPGVRVPEEPGCKPQPQAKDKPAQGPARAAPQPGFINMGNGLQVRISGQTDFEMQTRGR